eukprot:CAMPEP_0203677368 /NCGR_PEP_ID=MMETSP0090-20130426/27956_1 /ASSEMBLY_ACC=CAM_ASM_001088 /TAXON_ID=426623 /ORGANISM="Chaetoceros affinis, Strain CCMP159" /LENGTH=674 /DNA_ID=CAMNT_0050544241 /DNA_START=265 /DNA_END=2289 /DNA_ORIENTATION=-
MTTSPLFRRTLINAILIFSAIIVTVVNAAAPAQTQKVRNVHTSDFDSLAAKIMQQSVQSLLQASQSSNSNNNSNANTNDKTTTSNNNTVRRTTQQYNKKDQPVRIKFLTSPLEDAIAQSTDSSHKAGGNTVLSTIIPQISRHFQETISVEPLPQPISVPRDTCFGIYQDYIPRNFVLDGSEYDILIIVSAYTTVTDTNGDSMEFCSLDPNLTTLAAAISCGQDPYTNRPIVGLMNVCLSATANEPQSNMEEILSHELLHVFVLNEYLFPFYQNAVTGNPLSNPNSVRKVPCVNGKEDMVFFGISDETMVHRMEPVKFNGMKQMRSYYEITLPSVRQVVRNHFNCPMAGGARLENQPTNPNSCFGAHFDERFFQYNLMSALYDSTSVHFSPLTLALMEDSGWYKVNFRESQNSPFGLNSGCGFLTGECVVNGELPSYSEGNFCNEMSVDGGWRCDPGHHYRGACDLFDYRNHDQITRQRPEREYFTNPYLGPATNTHADWCPTVAKFSDKSAECSDVTATKLDVIEFFGENSRCMEVSINSNAQTSLCIYAECDYEEKHFAFDVEGKTYSCAFGEDGKTVQVIEGGKLFNFTCPKLTQACPDMFCPAMCSGKGNCDWEALPMPICNCFDARDTTAGCFESSPFDPMKDPNPAFKQSASLVTFAATLTFSILTIFV